MKDEVGEWFSLVGSVLPVMLLVEWQEGHLACEKPAFVPEDSLLEQLEKEEKDIKETVG